MPFSILPVLFLVDSSVFPLTGAHVVQWMVVGGVSLVLAVLAYRWVYARFAKWLHASSRNAAWAHGVLFSLGLIIAVLIDRIGFRELLGGEASKLDLWLMPAFVLLVPWFGCVSILIPIATSEEIERSRALELEITKWRKVYGSMRGRRDDLSRLAGCVSAAVRQRTHLLQQLANNGAASCVEIGDAADSKGHVQRLMEAIHHVFELRSIAAEITTPDAAAAPPDVNDASEVVTWRIALFEEENGVLQLRYAWNGKSDKCVFTDRSKWNELFSTTVKQAGTFAVNCFAQPHPLIVRDTETTHRDSPGPFKYFACSAEQRRRIRSIAGFSVPTTPKRVIVLDASRKDFFHHLADEAMFDQLQRIVHGQFEFEEALQAAIAKASKSCPLSCPQPSGPPPATHPTV